MNGFIVFLGVVAAVALFALPGVSRTVIVAMFIAAAAVSIALWRLVDRVRRGGTR